MKLRCPLPGVCLVGLLVLLLTGCPGTLPADFPRDGAPPRDTGSAGLPACVQTIFEDTCGTMMCHGGTLFPPNLVMAGVESRLINVEASVCPDKIYVVPGDPEGSFLYEKITQAMPTCGVQMPSGADALSATQISCIESWIMGMGGGGGDGGTRDGGSGGDGGTTDAGAEDGGGM